MSRMGQELVNMAESIDTMAIAQACIEALHERGINHNSTANVERLWGLFALHEMEQALDRTIQMYGSTWED
ncbi:hypothetical protein LCGC14_2530600 [marine sediment metagenome]|uniref:Uncharacterized protein n=1 Tax=marine sediment metagenome TaxID=412755 RepID=A0A0F9AU35_9ZZZZ